MKKPTLLQQIIPTYAAAQSRKNKLTPALIAAAVVLSLGHHQQALAQRPLGVDVSSFQGTPNWTSVRSSGITFAWAKATEGGTINDGDFTYNESNGKAAGVLMGAYHFAHPELNTPSTESGHFWSIAGGYIKADGKSILRYLAALSARAVTQIGPTSGSTTF